MSRHNPLIAFSAVLLACLPQPTASAQVRYLPDSRDPSPCKDLDFSGNAKQLLAALGLELGTDNSVRGSKTSAPAAVVHSCISRGPFAGKNPDRTVVMLALKTRPFAHQNLDRLVFVKFKGSALPPAVSVYTLPSDTAYLPQALPPQPAGCSIEEQILGHGASPRCAPVEPSALPPPKCVAATKDLPPLEVNLDVGTGYSDTFTLNVYRVRRGPDGMAIGDSGILSTNPPAAGTPACGAPSWVDFPFQAEDTALLKTLHPTYNPVTGSMADVTFTTLERRTSRSAVPGKTLGVVLIQTMDSYELVLQDGAAVWATTGLIPLKLKPDGAIDDRTTYATEARLDLAPYKLNDQETAIGFRQIVTSTFTNNQGHTATSTETDLVLYRALAGKLVEIYRDTHDEDLGWDADPNDADAGAGNAPKPASYTLKVLKTRTQGFNDFQMSDGKKYRWNGARYAKGP